MTAAAAASSCCFRLRQSRSRRARRDSASVLDSRSSCKITGTAIVASERLREGLDDRRLIGGRAVEAARPPHHHGFEPVVVCCSAAISAISMRMVSASDGGRWIVRHGEASVAVASLSAKPMRLAP